MLDSIRDLLNEGLRAHQGGRLAEAERCYRRVLAQEPRQPFALHLLGLVAHQAGQPAPAAELIRQALALQPGFGQAWNDLGAVLCALGDLPAAVDAFAEAVRLQPEQAAPRFNHARALEDAGHPDAAAQAYAAALALAPDHPEGLTRLALLRQRQGALEEAAALAGRAAELRPELAEAHNALGVVRFDQGRYDGARAAYRRALALRPDYPEARYGLGMLELLQGEWVPGWEDYEARWELPAMRGFAARYRAPVWTDQPLAGRRLLVHAEQGLGDSLQFVRFLPRLRALGAELVLECQPALLSLFRRLSTPKLVVAQGEPLPEHDLRVSLMSLPHRLGLAGADVGAGGYLTATAATDLPGEGLPRVGLVWAGSPEHKNDRNRSLRLTQLAPLLERAEVRFLSLQKGPAERELAEQSRLELVDLAPRLPDFAATADLVAALDLVIGVDTAVMHLAGALGRPGWLLLPAVPDWRWQLQRADSPWYPSLRLFRQPRPGDWAPVIAQLGVALDAWLAERRQGSG